MAACSRDVKQVQSLVTVQDGPFLTRQEADFALARALTLCVLSSAPPCCGECVERGAPCIPVVEEWDPSVGPFYSAPAAGVGWYYRIPSGMGITYRYEAKVSRLKAQASMGA